MSGRHRRLLVVVVLLGLVAGGSAGQEAAMQPVEEVAVSPELIVGQPAGPPIAGAELDRRTEELASIMRCPVCQALSVADSPTASAIAMREEARDLLAAGYTREQVLEYFEKAYGEFILLAPKKRGLNLLVWVAPAVFLLAGALLVALRVRSQGAAAEPVAVAVPDELSDYAERVRREVGS